MDFQFKGTVISANTVSGNRKDNGEKWVSQQVVIEEQKDKYQDILVGEIFTEDKIKSMNVSVGDEVVAYYNPKGSQWNGKWFPKNSIWKVDKLSSNSTATTQAPITQPQDDGSDLPF